LTHIQLLYIVSNLRTFFLILVRSIYMRRTVGLLCLFGVLSACLALAAPDADTALRNWSGRRCSKPASSAPKAPRSLVTSRYPANAEQQIVKNPR